MEEKHYCYTCKQTKPQSEYFKDRSRSSGVNNTCKLCDKAKRLRNSAIKREELRAQRRAEGRGTVYGDETEARIRQLKSQPCMDCGRTYPPVCMDFDHRDRKDKKFNMSEWRRHGAFEIVEEIAKCDVVCSNCHRLRTWPPAIAEVTDNDT